MSGWLKRFKEVIVVPSKPLKPCRQPGCKNVTASLYCETHVLNKKDTKRGSAAKRGYGSEREFHSKVRRSPNEVVLLRGVMVHVGRSIEGCI